MVELAKTYDPKTVEPELYRWWEEQGYFKPETPVTRPQPGKRFCITMPPPNVTGILHLGHAMTAALEDMMTRYHRMRGYKTLFLPGTDHAGIATQNVVERELAKEGLSRHALGREAFIQRVWEWKARTHARITDQHRQLGVSCDWTRERFTLDEGLSRAVRTAFVTLYERGLIFRGPYMVNWCPRCESAISDLEVEPEEHQSHLWHIRYPVVNADWDGPRHPWGSGRWAEGATEFIEMATTRPETILGDSGVAVHPSDERWQALIGREAVLPVLGRRIRIVGDEAVLPEFGTGAVKVTPAHDPTDYEIGQRHHLPQIDVMTPTGLMNEAAGPYAGLDRYACREAIVADFEREGLLVKVTPYTHTVGHCQRCHTVIEPRISTQWFLNVRPLAEQAIAEVRAGHMHIVPERFEKIFFNWLEAIRPWCISRQLWWGHRIPVWYCDACGHEWSALEDPVTCPRCGNTAIRQDEDVLDTWFSSGLWPFSTLGWPEETPDMREFYPTDVRETGYDILFFWVARETMLALALTGQVPYHTVYLHGLIRNERGEKISKSMPDAWKYDPLYIIQEYGTDALRYVLVTSSTPGNDMNLDPRRLEGARNFTNKLWQAGRFILMNLGEGPAPRLEAIAAERLSWEDRWILSRAHHLVQRVTELIEDYQYGEAGRQVRDFIWDEFCDWYIEACKVRLYNDQADKETPRAVLLAVLELTLRLLHPFMPYVTEALWQALPAEVKEGPALIVAPWPEADAARFDAEAEAGFALFMDLVRGIRNVRAEYNVEPGKRIPALIAAGEQLPLLETLRPILASLARLDGEALTLCATADSRPQAASVVVGDVVAQLPLAGLVDLAAERARLERALAELERRIAQTQARLASDFAVKAPAAVVERERTRLNEMEAEAAQVREQLKRLE